MPSYKVTYWTKETATRLVPLASSKREANEWMKSGDLEWCPQCKAAVEPEGRLDATGINNICPFCGTETQETIR